MSYYPKGVYVGEDDKDITVLYIAISAGVILGSAVVTNLKSQSLWVVDLLCSATNTGGGKLLIDYFKENAPNILLLPAQFAVPFYKAMGLRWEEPVFRWSPGPPPGPMRTPHEPKPRHHPYKR